MRSNTNKVKLSKAVALCSGLKGTEATLDYLSRGKTEIYDVLKSLGYTWYERGKVWHKSTRPVINDAEKQPKVKRFHYVRVSLSCDVADVEYWRDQWSDLIDLIGYKVWRFEAEPTGEEIGKCRVTVYARREEK